MLNVFSISPAYIFPATNSYRLANHADNGNPNAMKEGRDAVDVRGFDCPVSMQDLVLGLPALFFSLKSIGPDTDPICTGRRDTSLTQLQETLSRIEGKIDGLPKAIWSLDKHTSSGPNTQNSWDLPPDTFQSHNLVHSDPAHGSLAAAADGTYPSPQKLPSLGTTQNLNDQDFVLAIPFRHTTAPQNTLSWPCIQRTLVTPDLRYALRLELARPKPSISTSPPACLQADVNAGSWVEHMTLPQIRLLSRRYFEDLCPQAPVMTLKYFQEQILGPVIHEGFGSDLQTCVLLLVCALGSLSAVDNGDAEWQTRHDTQQASSDIENASGIGLGFFNLANEILRSQCEVTWMSCQAHLLAG